MCTPDGGRITIVITKRNKRGSPKETEDDQTVDGIGVCGYAKRDLK